MKLKILRSLEEKQKTRGLYHEIFPEDSEKFLDYYYGERCRDNMILAVEDSDEIIAMVHLNPYQMMVMGREAKAYYIYAVATKKSRRHEGHMRALLEKTFQLCREEGIPFVFLIPVDEAIYTPFGFETVAALQKNRHISPELLRQSYDLYCIRDALYLKHLQEEEALEDAEEETGVPENPVVMLRITDPGRMAALCGLQENMGAAEEMQWLKRRSIYISETV